MQTLKPALKELDTTLTKSIVQQKRIRGSHLYKLMRDMPGPRVCAICVKQSPAGMARYGDELDHIVPIWAGGGNNHTNLQWLCRQHHLAKSKQEIKQRLNGEGMGRAEKS
jgi:5-methylcytosine-specific restriction endonuclease McrA